MALMESEFQNKLEEFFGKFHDLNLEERSYNDNDDEKNKFYERKNKISMEFLNFINNANADGINVEENGLNWTYQRKSSPEDELYFDKILINFGEKGEKFTILPPVISEMEKGEEVLYDTLSNVFPSIAFKDHRWYTYAPHLEDIYDMRYYQKCFDDLDYFKSIIPNEEYQKYTAKCQKEYESYLEQQSEKDGLSQEQEELLLSILSDIYRADELINYNMFEYDDENLKMVITELVKKYDKESVINYIYDGYLDDIDTERKEMRDTYYEFQSDYDWDYVMRYLWNDNQGNAYVSINNFANYCDKEFDKDSDTIENYLSDLYRGKAKLESRNLYKTSDIENKINPREGEIQEVIKETEELARQNDKEESIEQNGQTQADE